MKLYDFTRAPNPRRVRIFLAEKGITVPMEQIDLFIGANRTPEALGRNPYGGLPVLELDDGTCIAEPEPSISTHSLPSGPEHLR